MSNNITAQRKHSDFLALALATAIGASAVLTVLLLEVFTTAQFAPALERVLPFVAVALVFLAAASAVIIARRRA